MRGRSTCPTGQEKNSVGATGESRSDFLQGKIGYQIAPSSAPVCALGHLWFMVASPGPDRTVPRTVRPPRGRLWTWELPCRASNPSAQWTRPTGHASQSFPARRRGKKIQSCFDRLRRPKHSSQPPVCPQGARSGCNPPILGGASHQAGNLTPPYSALPNEAQTPLAPPKILTARRSASPPDPPASAAPPQPGGSGPGSGPGSRWPSGPGGRRGPRCWSFSRSSPGPLGWTGWS